MFEISNFFIGVNHFPVRREILVILSLTADLSLVLLWKTAPFKAKERDFLRLLKHYKFTHIGAFIFQSSAPFSSHCSSLVLSSLCKDNTKMIVNVPDWFPYGKLDSI